MRIFGITKSGLLAMSLAVLSLWGCLGLEIMARARAERDARQALLQLDQLRRSPVPVSEPLPSIRPFHADRPSVS